MTTHKLPKILQWFSGNIGFHHIHRLSPKIPNYKLERCHKEIPPFKQVTVIRFWQSLKAASLKLWDEEQQRLVGFSHLRSLQSER
jgi:acyl-lipid omega-6 desaturase (Delta-12 desaturase)